MKTPAERAVAMYPGLLRRAVELSRGNLERGEDLVQEAFVACLRRPPAARTDLELRHWMRQVIFNLNAQAHRADEVSHVPYPKAPAGPVPEAARRVLGERAGRARRHAGAAS